MDEIQRQQLENLHKMFQHLQRKDELEDLQQRTPDKWRPPFAWLKIIK